MTFSVTVFHQELDRLRGGSLTSAGFAVSNEIEGKSNGLESWALLQVTNQWRLMAGYMNLDSSLHARPGSTDSGGPGALGNDPRHTLKARSLWRVRQDIDFDVNWRYVSKLAFLATVPSYSSTDVRLAWRATPALELSVLGSDIFHRSHVEFDEHGFPAHIPRAAYGQVRWQF
jgi:Outer membrane receptor for monomeric catechols